MVEDLGGAIRKTASSSLGILVVNFSQKYMHHCIKLVAQALGWNSDPKLKGAYTFIIFAIGA